MSRVGKKPILIPAGIEVKIESNKVTVKGPKGELSRRIEPEIKVELNDGKISVLPKLQTKRTRALWGTTRALVFNMVKGASEGFEKKLEVEGLGYKANVEGDFLVLSVGFSHQVRIKIPPGIKFSTEKNVIIVAGPDKELVGKVASEVRGTRPPEPYKGTGVRYQGEVIRRKAGKKVTAATGQ